MLNHNQRDCKLWLNGNGTLRKEDQQYGAWLRASTEKFYKSTPVTQPEKQHGTTTHRLQTISDQRGEANTIATVEDNPIMLESARASQLHTDKEILAGTELFQSHLQEIDRELTKFPNDPKVPNACDGH